MAEANSPKKLEIAEEEDKPEEEEEEEEEKTYIAPVAVYALKPNGPLPPRRGSESVMIILSSTKRMLIPPKSWALVPFGFKIAIPSGAYGRIEIRPVLAQNYGLFIAGGVIEAGDYDEVKATVFNHSPLTYDVEEGEEIAYLILEAAYEPCIWELMDEPLCKNKKKMEKVGAAMLKME